MPFGKGIQEASSASCENLQEALGRGFGSMWAVLNPLTFGSRVEKSGAAGVPAGTLKRAASRLDGEVLGHP
jgi:hypothetical protein